MSRWGGVKSIVPGRPTIKKLEINWFLSPESSPFYLIPPTNRYKYHHISSARQTSPIEIWGH